MGYPGYLANPGYLNDMLLLTRRVRGYLLLNSRVDEKIGFVTVTIKLGQLT